MCGRRDQLHHFGDIELDPPIISNAIEKNSSKIRFSK